MESVKEQEDHSEEYSDEDSEDESDGGQEEQISEKLQESQGDLKSSTSRGSPVEKSDTDLDALKMDELVLSDTSVRHLSRSPPQSRRELPLDDETPEEREDDVEDDANEPSGSRDKIKSIVSTDMSKKRAQQQRKYHSKRSARNAGRPQGSKAKQDTRVNLSDHVGWT